MEPRYLISHHTEGTLPFATRRYALAYIRARMGCARSYESESFEGTYVHPVDGTVSAEAVCVYPSPSARKADETGAFAWHLADLRTASKGEY